MQNGEANEGTSMGTDAELNIGTHPLVCEVIQEVTVNLCEVIEDKLKPGLPAFYKHKGNNWRTMRRTLRKRTPGS